MITCDVCCEKLNKINHKEVKCPFCDLTSCKTCSQKYILSTFEDPHCMGCKTLWNREFIDSFCTKYFRNTELRRHREKVLFEREKIHMPETQPEVERIVRMRKLRRRLQKQKDHLIELHNKYRTYNENHDPTQVPPEIRTLYTEMEDIYRELERLRSVTYTTEPRTFIRQCPNEICKGFLTENWYCGLCDLQYCKNCNEVSTDNHECDPAVVETMKLLNKDSKSCPTCGTVIHKTSGCAQMWCINCHTAFDWRTGEIETGRIHNPHFIEFKKKSRMSREHGDIPCGGIPSFRELRALQAPNDILLYALTIFRLEQELLYIDIRPINNTQPRIAYMLNDLDESEFKMFLQRQEKYREKMRDIVHLFEMITNTGGDLLRQFVVDPRRQYEIIEILKKLIEYGNEIIITIRKRYNSAYPKNIYI